MRIILADPQTLFRTALRQLLIGSAGIQVVAEAADGKRLFEQLEVHAPDLVLSEFLLPDIGGRELALELRRRYPKTGLMFVSACCEDLQVRAAMQAGANAFLSKCSEAAELDAALRAVGAGKIYVSPSLAHNLVEQRRFERGPRPALLTPRQRDVLRLIAVGKSTREAALQLGLSPKTIETHRARLMQTLGLRGISALTHFAVRFCGAAVAEPYPLSAARTKGIGARELSRWNRGPSKERGRVQG